MHQLSTMSSLRIKVSKPKDSPSREALRELKLTLDGAAKKPAWQGRPFSPVSPHLEAEKENWPALKPKQDGRPTLGLTGAGSSGSNPDPAGRRTRKGKKQPRKAAPDQEAAEAGSEAKKGSSGKQDAGGSPDPAREEADKQRKGTVRPNKRARAALRKRKAALRQEEKEDGSSGSKRAKFEEELVAGAGSGLKNRGVRPSDQKKVGPGSKDLRDLLDSVASRKGSGVKTGSGDGIPEEAASLVAKRGKQKAKRAGTGPSPSDRPLAGSGSSGSGPGGLVIRTNKKRYISQEMLPSTDFQIVGGLVKYQRDFLEVDFSREYREDKVRKNRSVAHPSRNILVVDSLHNPELLVPSEDLPSEVKVNPRLMLLPQVERCPHHAGEGQDCECLSYRLSGRYHRDAVMPDSCLKLGRLSPYEVSVKPAGLQFRENPGHFYVWDPVREDHYLGVPPPFLLGGSWPAKQYEPALSTRSSGPMVDLYYGMYDCTRFREVAATYQRCPADWTREENPVLCEAPPNTELGMVASRLYGLESVPRLSFTAHPAAEPKILLYPAMCRQTRGVPILYQDVRHPSKLDMVLGVIFRPFWEGGQGCILCPVCIMEVRQDGKPYPVYLGRHAYMQHWERFHYSSQVATYSFSATQLHTRLYMGQSIYTLVLANRNRGKDDITGMSVSVDVMQGLGVTDYDMGIMTLFPPEDKKKVVEVVDLGEAMEDTEPPSASEDCGGGDALEAINRWLDEPVPERIFQEDSEMEPGVMQVDPAAAKAAEAARVEPEATEEAEADPGAAGKGSEEEPYTLVTKSRHHRKDRRK